jgi:SAM-dependent methyltransferase
VNNSRQRTWNERFTKGRQDTMTEQTVSDATLDQMVAYYRARAAEYDEWFERRGRYDRGAESNARWFGELETVYAAFDALAPGGDVLELAPGTGIWTERILPYAMSIAAVDASPEMVAINRARVGDERVRYEIADLFGWQPTRRFDAVVFCFWISHVPLERHPAFWTTVAQALKPGGKLFFLDGRREPTSTAANHQLPEEGAQVMTRELNDGRRFEIVKNFYDPAWLAAQCEAVGLDVAVHETPTYFLYGMGTRKHSP